MQAITDLDSLEALVEKLGEIIRNRQPFVLIGAAISEDGEHLHSLSFSGGLDSRFGLKLPQYAPAAIKALFASIVDELQAEEISARKQ